jgi:hypothetical protein
MSPAADASTPRVRSLEYRPTVPDLSLADRALSHYNLGTDGGPTRSMGSMESTGFVVRDRSDETALAQGQG